LIYIFVDVSDMLQRPSWSTRTMWWIFVSSTARRILIGCRTSWTSSPGHCHSSARKVTEFPFWFALIIIIVFGGFHVISIMCVCILAHVCSTKIRVIHG